MGRLIKYEFRKQLLSKIIILSTLAVIEVMFLIGIAADSDSMLMTSLILFVLLGIGAIFYVSIEAILTFSNDLRTKHSYMLFMTPHSPYTIVGAKIITAIITIFATSILFVVAFVGNLIIYVDQFFDMKDLFTILIEFSEQLFDFTIDWTVFIPILLSRIANLCAVTTLGFVAITLSSTLLSNVKGRGFVSFVMFIGLTFIMGKLCSLFTSDNIVTFSTRDLWISCIVYAVFAVASFFSTGLLLKKKVDL